MPSLSHLRKLTSGKIDSVTPLKALKENGSISEDVISLFDEMYLQKSEEYVGGETVGTDEDGELYKGVLCFVIIGLKRNIPYIISTVPEKKLVVNGLKMNYFAECKSNKIFVSISEELFATVILPMCQHVKSFLQNTVTLRLNYISD